MKDEIPKLCGGENAPDLATLIFCLSAIAPENHLLVLKKIFSFLKEGAVLYFRDYGRYDFA